MLRQVFIIQKDDIIYQRIYGKALSADEVIDLRFKIKLDAKKKIGDKVGYFDYYKHRIVYEVDFELDLIFLLITGLMDDFFRISQIELSNLKVEFQMMTIDLEKNKLIDKETLKGLDPIIDALHKNISPKISVVGFSGVGKTTTKNLIKKGEISLRHIPTISGDIASIKIGRLEFSLFDFAGQEQFKYLWKGFIKGSNAVLIVTNSTPDNVEKSRFFLQLVEDEAPYALTAIIGNKQDLKGAMSVESIENILGVKTYPMVANRPENRGKMIKIIAEIMDLDIKTLGLLEYIPEEQFQFEEPSQLDQKVSDIISKEENEVKLGRSTETIKDLFLHPKLYDETIKVIKGEIEENEIKNHYNMIANNLKTLNDFRDYPYDEFNKHYFEYINLNLNLKNIKLKLFLEREFSQLKKTIESNKIKSPTDANNEIIIYALMCAYLTKVKPERFPKFESFLDYFNLDNLNEQLTKELNLYYLRILKNFNE